VDHHHGVTLRRAWVLPLTPTAAVLMITAALVPTAPAAPTGDPWLLAVLATAAILAAAVALAAGRLSGEPTDRPWIIAAATGALTAITPFAITALLGAPADSLIIVPWLIFGVSAAYWQLSLCEGVRSHKLHAAIGFGYTFVFTAVTLLLAVLSARLVD
jgi:hypothetical protein